MNEDWKCAVPKCTNTTDRVALVEIEGYNFSIKQFMCYTHISYIRYCYDNVTILADEWPRELNLRKTVDK